MFKNRKILISTPLDFIANKRKMSGEIEIKQLTRLQDIVQDHQGSLKYTLDTVQFELSKPAMLQLLLEGQLNVLCQRCLEVFDWPVLIKRHFFLVETQEAIPEGELEEESYDALVVQDELDVVALIEDEILLAMPIAPKHENCHKVEMKEEETDSSPFAILGQLYRKH